MMEELNVLSVADGPRISLALACHMLIARKTFPKARYHVAVPKGCAMQHAEAERVIRELATTIYEIPAPTTVIDGKLYRIENKIHALKYFDSVPALMIDSDLIFMRPLPLNFLFRNTPTAVPEHGLHEFPWARLYEALSLNEPKIVTLLGSGLESPPWLNAGLVATPNAAKFGAIWKMASDFVLGCDWVPERWPYLDQISLPLAMALYSPHRTVDYANILPSQFNDNIFHWHPDQSYAANSFVIHHHYRVALLRKYVPNLLSWVRDNNPTFDVILNDLARFDDGPKP